MNRVTTTKIESALVTEKKASGNDNLESVLTDLKENYRPKMRERSMRDFRIEHTAMIPNDKPIYMLGEDGQPTLLFRAGWYLSLEENHIKEQLLKDEVGKELNERMWSAMEQAGLQVTKKAGAPAEVKVVT